MADPGALPVTREAVASFADRAHFRSAVAALREAGFQEGDLSVLASHESLDAANANAERAAIAAGLTDDIKYLAPLTVAGIVFLSGGPVAVAIAAIVGAGLGVAALKEIVDKFAAAPHNAEFIAQLSGGAALLWVHCQDPDQELAATRILEEAGGRHVHVHGRNADA